MKKRIMLVIAAGAMMASALLYADLPGAKKVKSSLNNVSGETIKDGDLVFQSSSTPEGRAIQLATKSRFSHCGIIFREGDKFYVLEAVQPVQRIPLERWIDRGENDQYAVRRLKDADKILTSEAIEKMKSIGKQFIGKNYDSAFDWSDDKLYCSELVWKIYQRATGIEIGKPKELKKYNLNHPLVKQELRERYGNDIPLDHLMISPEEVFSSDLLQTVKDK